MLLEFCRYTNHSCYLWSTDCCSRLFNVLLRAYKKCFIVPVVVFELSVFFHWQSISSQQTSMIMMLYWHFDYKSTLLIFQKWQQTVAGVRNSDSKSTLQQTLRTVRNSVMINFLHEYLLCNHEMCGYCLLWTSLWLWSVDLVSSLMF